MQFIAEEHLSGCAGGMTCDCKLRRYQHVLAIGLIMVVVEAIAGYEGDSSSLLADALHLLLDNAGYIIVILIERARLQHKDVRTMKRNGKRAVVGMLLVFAVVVIYSATVRITEPRLAHGWAVMVVAIIGLAANVAQKQILDHTHAEGRDGIHHANIAHIIGDALISVAVIAGGIATALFGWILLDPILSILIGLWLLWSVIGLSLAHDDTCMHSHHH